MFNWAPPPKVRDAGSELMEGLHLAWFSHQESVEEWLWKGFFLANMLPTNLPRFWKMPPENCDPECNESMVNPHE